MNQICKKCPVTACSKTVTTNCVRRKVAPFYSGKKNHQGDLELKKRLLEPHRRHRTSKVESSF